MKGILSDQLLEQVISALANGENFEYADENTQVHVAPNGVSITYKSSTKRDDKDVKVNQFLTFCEELDDEVFIETCESFEAGELEKLQSDLDTDNYERSIQVFTQRGQEIAASKLEQIINEADIEIKINERIIKEAQAAIEDLHSRLDEAYAKYSL